MNTACEATTDSTGVKRSTDGSNRFRNIFDLTDFGHSYTTARSEPMRPMNYTALTLSSQHTTRFVQTGLRPARYTLALGLGLY